MHQLGIARRFYRHFHGWHHDHDFGLQNLKLIVAAVPNDVGPRLSSTGLQRIAAMRGKSKNPDSMAQAAAYIKEINHYAFLDNTDEEWEKWASCF